MRAEYFFGENYRYIWSDNWYLDGNRAWFMDGQLDMLFSLDRCTKQTSLESMILSDKQYIHRKHSRCIKKGDMIICLPYNGRDIWCYHLLNCLWTKIPIELPEGARAACYDAWFIHDKLYVVSIELKQIIEINIESSEIDKYHNLILDNQTCLSRSILIDHCIYIVASYPCCIYKFDCLKKSIKTYKFPEINDRIRTLCFDGEKFWLSGQYKKFYIWNEKKEKYFILDNFPNNFGVWNFSGKYENLLNCNEILDEILFIDSVAVGRYVWFIPFRTNEIIYVSKDTLEMNIFHVSEEMHTNENIKNQLLGHKYLLEYVREDRYIGLFSLKNTWIFEIDAKELKYKIIDYNIDKPLKRKIESYIIEKNLKCQDIVSEQEEQDLLFLVKTYKQKNDNQKNIEKQVGQEIYERLKE